MKEEINYYGKLLPEVSSRLKLEVTRRKMESKKDSPVRNNIKIRGLIDITDFYSDLSKLMNQDKVKEREGNSFPKKNYLLNRLVVDLEDNLNVSRYFVIFGLQNWGLIEDSVTNVVEPDIDQINYGPRESEENFGEKLTEVYSAEVLDTMNRTSNYYRLKYSQDTKVLFDDVEWILKELLDSIEFNIFYDKRKIDQIDLEDEDEKKVFLSGFETKYSQFDEVIRLLRDVLFFNSELSKIYCDERWQIIGEDINAYREKKGANKRRLLRKKTFYSTLNNSFNIFWEKEKEWIVESFRRKILVDKVGSINSKKTSNFKMSKLNSVVEEWIQKDFKRYLELTYEEYKEDIALNIGYQVKNILEQREDYLYEFLFGLNDRKVALGSSVKKDYEEFADLLISKQINFFKMSIKS